MLSPFLWIAPIVVPAAVMAVACWRLREARSKLFVPAGALALVSVITEVAAVVLSYFDVNNLPLYSAYQVAEVLLVTAMVRVVRPHWVWLTRAVATGALVALAWDAWSTRLEEHLSYGVLIGNVLLALLVLVLLFDLAQRSEEPLQYLPAFWLFVGMLVYLGGSPPVLSIISYLHTHAPEQARQLWMIMPWLTFIRYALGTYACVLEGRQRRSMRA